MATQLFLRTSDPDTHLGADSTTLASGNVGWVSRRLSDTRGTFRLISDATPTVTGATPGVEVRVGSLGLPAEWISPPVAADVTIAGTITANIWSSENNMSANVAINVVVDVIRANTTTTRNSNTVVEIGRSARVTEVAVTTPSVNNFTFTPTSTAVNRGDRLRVRVFGDDAGAMATGFTFDMSYEGPTAAADGDTYVTFSEDFSFESAPAGSTLYLTDTASAVSTASVDREAWTSRGAGVQTDVTNTAAGWTAPIQVTDTAGGTVADWFTRPLQAFTLTGMAQANIRALESNTAANASLRCEIARVEGDGTSPSVWASWCISPSGNDQGELTTSEVARTAWVSGDALAISDGQRLRIRLYIEDTSGAAMASGQTVTTYYAGTSGGASGDTYVTLPQTVTEFTAGGATGPAFRRQRRASRYLTFR